MIRQLMYYSTSHMAQDDWALDALTVQASVNNAVAGVTGLLWTDGHKFSQVIEGDPACIESLLAVLRLDPRHSDLHVVSDELHPERKFGGWSMTRPAVNPEAARFEQRMLRKLDAANTSLTRVFGSVITGLTGVASGQAAEL